MRPHTLLVVDDDETIRHSLADALSDDVTDVRLAESAESALALIGAGQVDVVLSDIRMPGLDGLEFLKLLRERAPHIDVVLMTAFDDMPTVVAAMREGAVEFLVKPLELHALRRVLDGVTHQQTLGLGIRLGLGMALAIRKPEAA